jgi:sugar diacid utilization regulator
MKNRKKPGFGQLKVGIAMNPLTYETMLTCSPLFHIDILAGWEGRKNECQHVFLNEMPMEVNSLVLIDLSDDTTSLLEKYLKDKNSSGMLILSKQSCDLPSFITELANEIKKPIFSLKNYSGEDLYKRINEIFYLHELKLLPLMKSDLTTYWLQLFNQQGIEYVIERFNMFLGQEVFLFTNKMKFVPLLANKYSAKDFKKMEKKDANLGQENQQFSIIHNEKAEFYSFEMTDPDGQIMGYLLFEKICPFEDLPLQLLETIVPTIISWLKQTEVTRNVHLIYKDQFLFDILHNNIDTESEIIELGQLRDMEFTKNAFVLSMNLNSHRTITKDIVMNIQDLLVENDLIEATIYTTYLNHRIVAIVCPPIGNEEIAKSDLNHWIGSVQDLIHAKYPDIQTKVGVGRSYYSNIDIYKSFQESKIALQMEMYGLGSDGIIHYEDLGFVRLLSYIHNDLLRDFSHQYLGKLEKYDRENETELVHTLSIYCAQNGDIVRTADGLFIHQNTLRQRLKKIEAILGIELNNYNNLVNLILSLQIYKDITIY